MMLKRILIVFAVLVLHACGSLPRLDEVVPDRRTEYQKSEALPDLEVPPDLTTDTLDDPLAIPNEEATTLSEFERRKSTRQGGNAAGSTSIAAGDQWVAVTGSVAEIWPKLREFWTGKGYTLDLDDPELGVLETQWRESGGEGITAYRDKFNVLAEAGESAGTTVIFITNQRQERIAAEGDSNEWVDIEIDTGSEKQIIGELNLHFYGGRAPAGTSSLAAKDSSSDTVTRKEEKTSSAKLRAEIQNLGDDKIYLALPDEFTRAWTLAEDAILKSGMLIASNDRSKGIYNVLFYAQAHEKADEGLLSKLKFWGDEAEEGTPYQLSLTGVGDKTELVVLNEKGDWASKEDAAKILTYIQSQYNSTQR